MARVMRVEHDQSSKQSEESGMKMRFAVPFDNSPYVQPLCSISWFSEYEENMSLWANKNIIFLIKTPKKSHTKQNTPHSQLWTASLIWGLSLALPGVHSNKTWKEIEYESMLLLLQLTVFCVKPSTKDQREMHSKVVWIQWFRKLSSLKYKGAFFLVNAALWECS